MDKRAIIILVIIIFGLLACLISFKLEKDQKFSLKLIFDFFKDFRI